MIARCVERLFPGWAPWLPMLLEVVLREKAGIRRTIDASVWVNTGWTRLFRCCEVVCVGRRGAMRKGCCWRLSEGR